MSTGTMLIWILISLTEVVQPEYSHFESEASAHKYRCCLPVWGCSSALHHLPLRKTGTFQHPGCRWASAANLSKRLTLANLKGLVVIPNNVVTKSETKQRCVSGWGANRFLEGHSWVLPDKNASSKNVVSDVYLLGQKRCFLPCRRESSAGLWPSRPGFGPLLERLEDNSSFVAGLFF